MSKNTGILIGVVALFLVIGAGVYASMQSASVAPVGENPIKEDSAMMVKEESGMEKAKMEMEKGETMMKKGTYEAYTPEKVARAQTGDVVLFFHASWCPSCRGLESDIQAHVSSIPEGVSILKVDYDSETALKTKYGVTTQHTLVQVDAEGNAIKKWSGGAGLSNLLAQII